MRSAGSAILSFLRMLFCAILKARLRDRIVAVRSIISIFDSF